MVRRLPALLALVAGCGGEPATRELLDLVAGFFSARTLSEPRLIDLGTGSASAHLLEGWSWNETKGDGTTLVWSLGDESALEFHLSRVRPLTVRLRCWPLPLAGRRQVLRPALNGEPLPALQLGRGWGEYELRLPAANLARGRNRLAFRYGYVHTPPDAEIPRALAVAFDWLRFPDLAGRMPRAEPETGNLVLPGGSAIDYWLRAAPGSVLRLAGVSVRGPKGTRLTVDLAADGASERRLAQLENGDHGPLALRLPVEEGALRLRLGALAGSGPGVGTVTLAGPRVVAAAPASGAAGPGPGRRPAGPARPDVVLYVVDTLRADHLTAYGSAQGLTPRLDELADEAIVFRRHFAQSAATLPTMASIFTGLHAWRHGTVTQTSRLPERLATLPELLRDAGYETAAVVANGFVSATFGFAEGFDRFRFLPDLATRADTVHAEALAWLYRREPGAPFFLYVHVIDPHSSYDPPPEYRGRYAADVSDRAAGSRATVYALKDGSLDSTPERVADHRRLYAGEVAWTDAAFGSFVDALEKRGLYHDSLFVFLSDHGEEFYEHSSWTHGHSLYGELLNVPLIVRLPGGEAGGTVVAAPVQQIDLLPTLLDRLGIEPPGDLPGSSLLDLIDGPAPTARPVFSSLEIEEGLTSVVLGEWKLIARHDRAPLFGAELYDLAGDPGELRNLVAARPVLAGFLASLVRAQRRAVAPAAGPEAAEIDPEMRAHLRALGYLQ